MLLSVVRPFCIIHVFFVWPVWRENYDSASFEQHGSATTVESTAAVGVLCFPRCITRWFGDCDKKLESAHVVFTIRT